MQTKKAITNKAAIDRTLTKMIRTSTKAPKNLKRQTGPLERSGKEKQKMKLPWTLILIIAAIIIIVALYILWKSKTREGAEGRGMAPGDRLDEPVDLKGRDIGGLLDEFGYT